MNFLWFWVFTQQITILIALFWLGKAYDSNEALLRIYQNRSWVLKTKDRFEKNNYSILESGGVGTGIRRAVGCYSISLLHPRNFILGLEIRVMVRVRVRVVFFFFDNSSLSLGWSSDMETLPCRWHCMWRALLLYFEPAVFLIDF